MRRVIAVIAVVSILAVFGSAASADAPPKNVILIGWDGAQREHVQQSLQRGELPALKALSTEGALVDIDVVSGATDTKAGWTQILTGYAPKITGVQSNGQYRDVPKGYSVFERLKEHFGADSIVCAAIIGKKAHCGEINPPFKKRVDAADAAPKTPAAKRRARANVGNKAAKSAGKLVVEDGVTYRVFGGSPYFTMHKSCDVWEFGLEKDVKVGTRALELIEQHKGKPFFFFVHFAEVDHSGHRHGENSKEYNDALISNDAWTGKIVAKLKELGLYDKTLIYITADHGFNEGQKNHKYAPYVFLATNDAAVGRAGMRQDITPTILSRMGVDISKLAPPLTGEPLTTDATKPVKKAPAAKPARKARPKAATK